MGKRKPKTMVEILMQNYTKDDLIWACRKFNIKKYSNLKKSEIAELIAKRQLSFDHMYENLLYLSSLELEMIEEIIEDGNYTRIEGCEEECSALDDMCYAYIYFTGSVELASDFNDMYYKVISDENFLREREKVEYIEAVYEWIYYMYLACPRDIFEKLLRLAYPGENLEDVMDIVLNFSFYTRKCEYDYERDMFIASYLLEEREEDVESIFAIQGDMPFYIPEEKEIHDLFLNGYLSKELKYVNLKNWFITYMQVDESEAEMIVMEIWIRISTMVKIDSIEQVLENYDVIFDSEDELREFSKVIEEVILNTRCALIRGAKLGEVFKEEIENIRLMDLEDMEEKEDTNVISMEEWKKKNMN